MWALPFSIFLKLKHILSLDFISAPFRKVPVNCQAAFRLIAWFSLCSTDCHWHHCCSYFLIGFKFILWICSFCYRFFSLYAVLLFYVIFFPLSLKIFALWTLYCSFVRSIDWLIDWWTIGRMLNRLFDSFVRFNAFCILFRLDEVGSWMLCPAHRRLLWPCGRGEGSPDGFEHRYQHSQQPLGDSVA